MRRGVGGWGPQRVIEEAVLEGGRLPCAVRPRLPPLPQTAPPSAPFAWLLKNILPSKLPWGEKGGVPFHAKQGVVREGPREPVSLLIPTSFFLSFFLLSAIFFFVSLIGLTDHKLFHREGVGKGERAAGYRVPIPGNQYDGRAERARRERKV